MLIEIQPLWEKRAGESIPGEKKGKPLYIKKEERVNKVEKSNNLLNRSREIVPREQNIARGKTASPSKFVGKEYRSTQSNKFVSSLTLSGRKGKNLRWSMTKGRKSGKPFALGREGKERIRQRLPDKREHRTFPTGRTHRNLLEKKGGKT